MSDHHEASYEALKAVVRRNTLEVQSGGNFELFDELSPTTFWTTHRSQAGRQTRKERVAFTTRCAKPSRTSMPKFTGKRSMAIS